MNSFRVEADPVSDKPEITRLFLSDDKEEGLSIVLGGECHFCEQWPIPAFAVTDPFDPDEESLICSSCVTDLLRHDLIEKQEIRRLKEERAG